VTSGGNNLNDVSLNQLTK